MQLGNKRKRKTQAIQEMHSGVDHCLCGVHADSSSNAVAQCKRNLSGMGMKQNGYETKWVRQIASNISSINLTNVLVSLRMHTARKSAKELGLRGLFIVPERLRKTCTAMMSLLPYIDRCLIT